MLLCVKRLHVKWMLWNDTLGFWVLSLHANIRCIHLLKERQRRLLIHVAWRGKGLRSCGILWACLKHSDRSLRWRPHRWALPSCRPCAPKQNKQWRRSCQHPNCLEVPHLLALDGPVHCKHTWSTELYHVNRVLKAEFTHRRLTPGCEKVNLIPFVFSCPAVPGLLRELGGNCLSAPCRQVDDHCEVQSGPAQLCTF